MTHDMHIKYHKRWYCVTNHNWFLYSSYETVYIRPRNGSIQRLGLAPRGLRPGLFRTRFVTAVPSILLSNKNFPRLYWCLLGKIRLSNGETFCITRFGRLRNGVDTVLHPQLYIYSWNGHEWPESVQLARTKYWGLGNITSVGLHLH